MIYIYIYLKQFTKLYIASQLHVICKKVREMEKLKCSECLSPCGGILCNLS